MKRHSERANKKTKAIRMKKLRKNQTQINWIIFHHISLKETAKRHLRKIVRTIRHRLPKGKIKVERTPKENWQQKTGNVHPGVKRQSDKRSVFPRTKVPSGTSSNRRKQRVSKTIWDIKVFLSCKRDRGLPERQCRNKMTIREKDRNTFQRREMTVGDRHSNWNETMKCNEIRSTERFERSLQNKKQPWT